MSNPVVTMLQPKLLFFRSQNAPILPNQGIIGELVHHTALPAFETILILIYDSYVRGMFTLSFLNEGKFCTPSLSLFVSISFRFFSKRLSWSPSWTPPHTTISIVAMCTFCGRIRTVFTNSKLHPIPPRLPLCPLFQILLHGTVIHLFVVAV